MSNASTLLWSALETFFTPREQLLLFLCSILLGVGLGIFFDCLRTLRVFFTHTRFFVAVEDVAFLLVWGIALVTFAMEKGRGEVRFYYLLGSIIGFILYIFTVGRAVISVIKAIAGTVFWIFRGLHRIFVAPVVNFFVTISNKLIVLFGYIRLKFKKIAGNSQMHLKDTGKVLYNKTIGKKIVKDVNTLGNVRGKDCAAKKAKGGRKGKKSS